METTQNSPENQKTILLVEDDEDILGLMTSVLEIEGFKVSSAQNGQEALNFLLKSSSMPSLILLDLMMPVMDGAQFRKEQVKNPKIAGIPVVIMSAASQIEERIRECGAAAYLRKPLEIENLIETVKKF